MNPWDKCIKSLRMAVVANQRSWEKMEEAYLLCHRAVELLERSHRDLQAYNEIEHEACVN